MRNADFGPTPGKHRKASTNCSSAGGFCTGKQAGLEGQFHAGWHEAGHALLRGGFGF